MPVLNTCLLAHPYPPALSNSNAPPPPLSLPHYGKVSLARLSSSSSLAPNHARLTTLIIKICLLYRRLIPMQLLPTTINKRITPHSPLRLKTACRLQNATLFTLLLLLLLILLHINIKIIINSTFIIYTLRFNCCFFLLNNYLMK